MPPSGVFLFVHFLLPFLKHSYHLRRGSRCTTCFAKSQFGSRSTSLRKKNTTFENSRCVPPSGAASFELPLFLMCACGVCCYMPSAKDTTLLVPAVLSAASESRQFASLLHVNILLMRRRHLRVSARSHKRSDGVSHD